MVRLSLALSLLATSALAARNTTKHDGEIVRGAYIVEFEDGSDFAQFRSQALPEYTTRMTLDYGFFKGVSIQLDNETAEENASLLASLPAVKKMWPVKRYSIAEVEGINDKHNVTSSTLSSMKEDNATFVPHVMTGIDKLREAGVTGEGVTIALVDTGIDYTHPALGGCFGEGCVVTHGYDFVGASAHNGGQPDDDPLDICHGTGTHVAGIIAAQGVNPRGFTGAAPGVKLAAYRVVDCYSWFYTDTLIAAFNRAYEDGADIIVSANIRVYSGHSDDPWALTVSKIVEKGVPCILPAGNGGISMFDSTTPAGGKGVTSVASFDSPITIGTHFVATYTVDGENPVSFPWEFGLPYSHDGLEREVWAVSLNSSNTNDACEPLPDDTPWLADYFVLFGESSECDTFTQVSNLFDFGAWSVVRYDAGPDITSFYGHSNTLSATAIYRETAETFLEILRAGKTLRLTIDRFEFSPIQTFRFENRLNPGAMSTYSSWGPTFDMQLKPQFGAPGRYIESLWFTDEGSYAIWSGTAQAVGMVAASYALVSEARGIKPEPALFESIFASTSKAQLYSWRGPFQNFLAPASEQGAGLIQAYDAAFSKAYLEPSGLSFNDTANLAGPMTFTIVNDGEEATFDISYRSSETFYSLETDEAYMYLAPGERSTETAELSFSETKVTVAAGSTATVEVTASPPEGLNAKRYPYWSGFITVNGTDGSALSIPYQGIVGSLYEANVLPYMFVFDYADWYYNPIAENTTFYLPEPTGGEPDWSDPWLSFPVMVFDLPWGAEKVVIEVVPATTCPRAPTYPIPGGYKSIGEISGSPGEFYPRGYQNEAIWTGQLASGEYAPAGRYRLAIRVQRLLSEGTKDEDWVTLTTPAFNIVYP
ncbi:peptidase S8/S53 domain-containing protein [Stachybotrys elegans]|uniref:Peptidase S8/S53 domain-containing protein n=1 Tax=Stachybotrys elegans TaxID=80388 RepID=A0A8K0SQ55_9HYPO|nr:peptidase S8/S53 domain-containing protein [Stachybotrys elegans]